MRLYLSGNGDVDLLEKALRQIVDQGGKDSDRAKSILERMEGCKMLQKPYCNEKHPPDES